MTDDDLDRQWVEHARDPDTDTTPRTAFAAEAGAALVERGLARHALPVIDAHTHDLADRLEGDDSLRQLGAEILPLIDFDELPSRLVIHQDLVEQGEAEPDEIVADVVADRWRELAIQQVPIPELLAAAARADVDA